MKSTLKAAGIPSMLSEVRRSFDPSVLKTSYESLLQMLGGSRYYTGALVFFWLAVYASTFVALDAISHGYHHAYNATREIPWGILISTYIFFVVTSTGLCIIASMGHIFGIKNLEPISKRALFLSIVTIICGFIVILLEIENPFRMILYNVLSPNLTSNIWWMGTLYGICMFFMIIEFGLIHLNFHKTAIITGLIALIADIAANGNLGAIFGMLYGRDLWYGPFLPIFFITSGTMTAAAAIIFFTWLAYKINGKVIEPAMAQALKSTAKLCAFLVVVILFFTSWNIITGLVGNERKVNAILSYLTGGYAINFWVFEILFALLIPLALLLFARGKNMAMMVSASVFMLIGVFVMRYDFVIIGQVVSGFQDMGVNEYHDLLSYTPSFHEVWIAVGAFGIAAMSFMIGEKVFKGHMVESEPHDEHKGGQS